MFYQLHLKKKQAPYIEGCLEPTGGKLIESFPHPQKNTFIHNFSFPDDDHFLRFVNALGRRGVDVLRIAFADDPRLAFKKAKGPNSGPRRRKNRPGIDWLTIAEAATVTGRRYGEVLDDAKAGILTCQRVGRMYFVQV